MAQARAGQRPTRFRRKPVSAQRSGSPDAGPARRALGFGLAEIGQLLDPRIEQSTSEALLTHQVDALQWHITEAPTRLVRVQHRLNIIQSKSMQTIMNLSVTALPSLNV